MSNEDTKKSIGVFDSGFGGLSILRDIHATLPQYSYIYLGDTARAPYGSRSLDEVYTFTLEAVNFLFAQGCELVILACNTASAEALRKIQHEYLPLHHPGKHVLGVIIPAAEEAVAHDKKSSRRRYCNRRQRSARASSRES
jgi:glutamate racemase